MKARQYVNTLLRQKQQQRGIKKETNGERRSSRNGEIFRDGRGGGTDRTRALAGFEDKRLRELKINSIKIIIMEEVGRGA